jgi:hypothetical protein
MAVRQKDATARLVELSRQGIPNGRLRLLNNAIGPRNLIHSWATDRDDPTTDPRWGRVGKQRVVDEGPLPPGPREGIHYNMTTFDEVITDTWPDGGTTPFAGAKGEVTEGSFRVPANATSVTLQRVRRPIPSASG